ncbi:hypothetical protein [Bacillus sp. 179-C3.3 HS]|uniref:hypothetical protein n=1 Tax=Bacillus sp. 179-C3.3 HS TaxID=3232162 RepID=UPI0039A3BC42
MNKFISKLLIVSLATLLLVSTLLPTASRAATPNKEHETIASQQIQVKIKSLKDLSDESEIEDSIIQTKGFRGYLVKIAAEVVADGIRYGGKAVSLILKNADGKAAKDFTKNSNFIAKKIEEIANIPDVTSNMIKKKLYAALEPKIGGGSAQVIADGVYYAINFFLF